MIDSFKSLLSSGANRLATSPRAIASALLDSIIRMSATRTNYWLEFIVTGCLATALLASGVAQHDGSWLDDFLTVMAGLLAFSFIEYVFHRWIFHGPESMYRRGHDAHHRDPLGYDALPFFLPSAILLGLTLLFSMFMPPGNACLLGGAIAFGYVTYGLSHFAIHATRFRLRWIRQWAARHHVHHHHPHGNFGVTTPLWDYVLGTRYQRDRGLRHKHRR